MEKTLRPRIIAIFVSLAVTGIGCTEHSISDRHSLFVLPAVLDFGKVRPTDSPVKLTLNIFNHGDQNVTVTEVLSGCGCTVVDIPREPIPAHGQVDVTLRVNVSGRFGHFENELTIKTATEPDVKVAIRGNIETDIWANGQSLRCSVGPKERRAFTMLVVYTAKYPEIAFADAPQEYGVTLKEISRTTNNGETAIRFSVEVDMDGKAVITRTVSVVPRDSSIAPLAIPLYCYREEVESM